LVDNIPPFSSEELVVTPGNADKRDSAKVTGNALDNDFLSLSINPETGAIASLKWKKNGIELVDAARGGWMSISMCQAPIHEKHRGSRTCM